ncbi:nitrous-oxide reductase, partial [Citreimonas salinaria]
MDKEEFRRVALSRRQMLGSSAAIAGVAGAAGLGAFGASATGARAQGSGNGHAAIEPGELDEYYVFVSGGQSGEVRIQGLPSMRELMRIPVFNR